jgi:hypothetical protein
VFAVKPVSETLDVDDVVEVPPVHIVVDNELVE